MKIELTKEISNWMLSRREKIKMSAVELSRRTGISQSTICRLERGQSRWISYDKVILLSRVLGKFPMIDYLEEVDFNLSMDKEIVKEIVNELRNFSEDELSLSYRLIKNIRQAS